MYSRNTSTVRGLFCFTAVWFSSRAASTKLIFTRGCADIPRSPCASPRPGPAACRRRNSRYNAPSKSLCWRSLVVWGPCRTCEKDVPALKDLELRLLAVEIGDPWLCIEQHGLCIRLLVTGAEWGLVFTLCWWRSRVVPMHGQPVLGGCRTWGALQGQLLWRLGWLLIPNAQAANHASNSMKWQQILWFMQWRCRLLRCRRCSIGDNWIFVPGSSSIKVALCWMVLECWHFSL